MKSHLAKGFFQSVQLKPAWSHLHLNLKCNPESPRNCSEGVMEGRVLTEHTISWKHCRNQRRCNWSAGGSLKKPVNLYSYSADWLWAAGSSSCTGFYHLKYDPASCKLDASTFTHAVNFWCFAMNSWSELQPSFKPWNAKDYLNFYPVDANKSQQY